MSDNFRDRVSRGVMLFDGATGTMLQRFGLKPGGCPDHLNLSNPDIVMRVHRAYLNAGSDIITTNTFGANRIKLSEYGLSRAAREINMASAANVRKVVKRKVFVAGGIGPTGRFLEPVGDLSFDEAVSVFSEQVVALKEGGVDLIIIETMMDIKEVRSAIISVREVSDLPVVATMTFDESMRTVLGTSPEVFAVVGEGLQVDSIGANCSLGIGKISEVIKRMSIVSDTPLTAQANAGIPVLRKGETIFPDTPEDMSGYVSELLESGTRLIGGCCGTTPEHIVAFRKSLEKFGAVQPIRSRDSGQRPVALASRTRFIALGCDNPPVIVGERINPTGKKGFASEIKQGKTITIRREARGQESSGAHLLDVNVGVPGIDEISSMERGIFAVNENSSLPLVLDSSNPLAVERGLKSVDGRLMINSISGEEKKLNEILPLAKRYGASVIVLALDDTGIPDSARGRFRVARDVVNASIASGLRRSDIVVDCLAMTVSAGQDSARETLKAVRMVKEELGVSTILGVSNISFGLPAREKINAVFLAMAIQAGLDSAIINPYSEIMIDTYHSALLLMGHDKHAEVYIDRFKEARKEDSPLVNKEEGYSPFEPESMGEQLKRAVIEGDEENIVALVEDSLSSGMDPLTITNSGLLKGLEEVGRRFAANIYFLPQVMLSADTMKRAFERLKREIGADNRNSLGKVLMATVEGDIHDIGKNIVTTLLENNGFEVIDLGKNVKTEKIVSEAVKQRVDIVGLSALMTTTVSEMERVIERLKEEGFPVVTMVGGAVVTSEYAGEIGADGYARDAVDAVDRMKAIMQRKRSGG